MNSIQVLQNKATKIILDKSSEALTMLNCMDSIREKKVLSHVYTDALMVI